MNNISENVPTPERRERVPITIDADLFHKLEMAKALIESEGYDATTLLLDYGVTELTPESLVDISVKGLVDGIAEQLEESD